MFYSLPVHAQALIQDRRLLRELDKTPGDYLRQAPIPMGLLFKEIRYLVTLIETRFNIVV